MGETTSERLGAVELLRPVKRSKMKVVAFYGTFDPVHSGHILAAEECLRDGVDEVVFVPRVDINKPHAASHHHRKNLACYAIGGNPQFNALLSEQHCSLGDSSGGFTLRPLLELLRAVYDTDSVGELCGSDPFVSFPPDKHRDYFHGQTIYVASRPPYPPPPPIPEGCQGALVRVGVTTEVSSTELRGALSAGSSYAKLVECGLCNADQLAYIAYHKLYHYSVPSFFPPLPSEEGSEQRTAVCSRDGLSTPPSNATRP